MDLTIKEKFGQVKTEGGPQPVPENFNLPSNIDLTNYIDSDSDSDSDEESKPISNKLETINEDE